MHNYLPKIFYFINEFDEDYIRNLDKKIAIIYRNYKKKINYSEILKIKNFCKNNRRKFYLSNNITLSISLKLDGVYLPSFNKQIIDRKKLNKNFIILGSAHNVKQLRIKEKQNTDLIFLSPLFDMENKKNILGIYKFNILANQTKKKVIALGGINENNIKKLNLIKPHGFASISLIKNNYNSIKSIVNKF